MAKEYSKLPTVPIEFKDDKGEILLSVMLFQFGYSIVFGVIHQDISFYKKGVFTAKNGIKISSSGYPDIRSDRINIRGDDNYAGWNIGIITMNKVVDDVTIILNNMVSALTEFVEYVKGEQNAAKDAIKSDGIAGSSQGPDPIF